VEIVLGKHSGVPNIEVYLDKLGIKGKTDDEKKDLVMAVKDAAMSKRRPITEAEFAEMAK
jgi:isopropylmalate/homocitrate/citramalate synthase